MSTTQARQKIKERPIDQVSGTDGMLGQTYLEVEVMGWEASKAHVTLEKVLEVGFCAIIVLISLCALGV